MTKTLRLLPAIAAAALLSGCYVNFSAPTPNLTVKLDADSATRQGSSVCTGFLWAFGSGDCSVTAAMRNGKITKVHHVDSNVKVIFWGGYVETTVVAYGE